MALQSSVTTAALLHAILTLSGATVPHLCGPACGPLFANYQHNDSCWRSSTQSFFSWDLQPHYHIGDSCFGENDPSAPFYFNGVYHIMWQSHTQYVHIPPWNTGPSGQAGDVGISFGHAVSTDLAHWKQLSNAVWPDEWFTSVSVYDGSATITPDGPVVIAAGLTPNTTSVFCHARATPANLSDPELEDWVWASDPLCGTNDNGLTPFDAPTSAWKTSLGQWLYEDGRGNVFVSDDFKKWRGAKGKPPSNGKFPGGTVCDFFPLPRSCDGCGQASMTGAVIPTHVHEAQNTYELVQYTEGGRDESGTLLDVPNGGALVASATSLGLTPNCDHGHSIFPKSFFDPVKKRRIQYGWVQAPGLGGEEDAMLDGLRYKANHQSLLREITYDPRLGMLCFFPVEETALLRRQVLASISTSTEIPAGGVLPLPTSPNSANQSEVRVSFALPSTDVIFGVRVMGAPEDCSSAQPCSRSFASPGLDFSINFTQAPANASAWAVRVGQLSGCPQACGLTAMLPLLHSDKQIEMTLYVDHTVVEVYFAGGRVAMTASIPKEFLLLPRGKKTQQVVEIFASKPGVIAVSATVWRMDNIWDPETHGRPHIKPNVVNPEITII
eukprot:TRINITY_DN30002_c0_g1_i1.p1 TRINITY_DN30002_c0_g1~~TRINITY_DN30002_c0_g1_i1.p1  ORF type:complete len:610 (+),score=56.67 TRINITY_DN30002_c0_g1_i1:174-2003(+)